MLFNSFQFLLFFPVVTLLFWLLPHKFRWLHLLTASVLFYCAFLPVYVLILVVTIIVDYFAGILIYRATGKGKGFWLLMSLLANIGFLCFFKYYDFFIANFNKWFSLHIPNMDGLWVSSTIMEWNNWTNTVLNRFFHTDLAILKSIILPIGLSFHTFQAMSYTIEVYRGNQKPEKHFGIYSLYVMFYPQLVAGPIERPQNILHQFHEPKRFTTENLVIGLRLMAWGLFKKVVIADRLAFYVNTVYQSPENFHWFNLVIATLFFAVQIYCDFSGYSDIAIGAARTMGYKLMINFKRPYFASNIKTFWDKWHVSLSTWFRDYLYIPLGGNRRGFERQLFNLVIVFLISGFWHGANWTFVIWGGLHAIYSVVFMLWDRYASGRGIQRDGLTWTFGGWILTMLLVCLAWVFFRAENLSQAWQMLSQIFMLDDKVPFKFILLDNEAKGGFGLTSFLIVFIAFSYMFFIEKKFSPLLTELNRRPWLDILFLIITVLFIILLGMFNTQSFIYFQF